MPSVREALAVLKSKATSDPTIRSRVVSLIAFLLVPFFLIFTWLAGQLAQSQRHAIELERGAIADKVTHILDRRISNIEGMLTGLASSEDVSSGDFDSIARHSKAIASRPDIRLLRVLSLSGDVLTSTDPDFRPTFAPGEQADLLEKERLGQVVVSDIHQGSNSEPDSFSITAPVFQKDKVKYALSAEMLPNTFANIFRTAELPETWVAAVIDRDGRYIARSLNADQYIGELARPELIQVAGSGAANGGFDNVTHEGVAVANSFRRSMLSGWTTVVAVRQDELQAPIRRFVTYLLIGGGVLTLLSLGLASLLAARIYAPVRQLRDETVAIIAGRTLPEGRLRIAELNDVRDAFAKAIAKSAHLAAIVESSGDAIISTSLDGRIQSWNHGAESLFGYSAKEMIGRAKATILPESQAGELEKHIAVIKEGETLRTESKRRTRDGEIIDVALEIAPIRDVNGKVTAMSSIIHDITARKKTEKHQRFLMRELTHRSKNLLAIVQSMARQTARSAKDLNDFEAQYIQRLQGLAASHDLLVNENWVGAPLAELVRRQVTPFVETNRANLAVTGPDVMISAKAAQAIGLALHELSTNSMKYGALSTPKGKVSIDWEYLSGEPKRLQLKWEEHHGPPVTPPERKGFGHFVIERMTTQTLDAMVSLDFNPDGVIWTVVAPLEALQNEPDLDNADD